MKLNRIALLPATAAAVALLTLLVRPGVLPKSQASSQDQANVKLRDPRLVSFQGHLTRPSASDAKWYEAVPDGRYDLLFTLYSAPVGGESRIWGPERHEKLVVVNGLVNALIGSVDGGLERLTPAVLAGPLYVGITIDADGKAETPDLELVPRQILLPVMYAHEAGDARLFAGHAWEELDIRLKRLERKTMNIVDPELQK